MSSDSHSHTMNFKCQFCTCAYRISLFNFEGGLQFTTEESDQGMAGLPNGLVGVGSDHQCSTTSIRVPRHNLTVNPQGSFPSEEVMVPAKEPSMF